MRPILRRAAAEGQPPSRARRTVSFALAVAAHLLIAWLLLRLAPPLTPREPAPALETFSIAPGPRPAPERPSATAARRPAAGSPPPPTTPAPPPPIPDPTPPVDLSLFGDRALAGAADLSRLPARGRSGDAEGEETGAADSVAPYGPGEGPGGQRLYNAEWQREPTDAELRGYLPNGAPAGAWALIACRTIADYQVDNCRVLGESPVGSRLGSAMRQAAWQFRVLPPRRGGRKLIGAWVRIRIDFGKLPTG